MVDKEVVVGVFLYQVRAVLHADQDEVSLRGQYHRLPDEPALVHGMCLGALSAEALFKVPQKVLIWGTLIELPLIYA
jgi:hypothetical protein